MSAPVDVLAVLDSHIAELRANGDTGNVENLLEASVAVAELIRESGKIESDVHTLGMTCPDFSAALARVRGAA